MMKKLLIPLGLAVYCLSNTGCYYDVEEELYANCDTTQVTYTIVNEVITNNGCYNCHIPGGGAPFSLTGYQNLKAKVLDQTLIPAISQTGPHPMPPVGPRMTNCELNKIKAWINEGALDN
jgi:mono/diheme cytochrome c family protein